MVKLQDNEVCVLSAVLYDVNILTKSEVMWFIVLMHLRYVTCIRYVELVALITDRYTTCVC